MSRYILRRLLLMIPTLIGIMLLNFIIVQAAPGGPIDQMLARFEGMDGMASTRLDAGGGDVVIRDESRAARGIDPALSNNSSSSSDSTSPPMSAS